MSTKIEVNAMGDACPLPVVKTLKRSSSSMVRALS